jgi:hypothetical protein
MCGVFELPLPRNAQKTYLKKAIKKYLGLVGSSKVDQIYVGVRHFFVEGPLEVHVGAFGVFLTPRKPMPVLPMLSDILVTTNGRR